MLSSTWPFSVPNAFCCAANSAFVRFVTAFVSPKIRTMPIRETVVNRGLRQSIMAKIRQLNTLNEFQCIAVKVRDVWTING